MTTLILIVALIVFYAVVVLAALALAAMLDRQREEALNQFLRERSGTPRASVADADLAVSDMTDVRARRAAGQCACRSRGQGPLVS